jgi:predicted NAD/FAD-dependent oxidoreductase
MAVGFGLRLWVGRDVVGSSLPWLGGGHCCLCAAGGMRHCLLGVLIGLQGTGVCGRLKSSMTHTGRLWSVNATKYD